MKLRNVFIVSLLALVYSFICLPGADASVKSETIEYKDGRTILEGYLAYNGSIKGKRPGILIVHQWKGITEYEKDRARMLAKLGYTALVADIYGKGKRPKDSSEAQKESSIYKSDRELLRKRAALGLNALAKHKNTDASKLAAMGYCFGGTAVLELARSGASVKAAVSFHGGLATPTPGDAKNIKGTVLVLHGADDPYVPQKEVSDFQEEMKMAKVDWYMVSFGNAVHSFTEVQAGNDNSKGVAYNEDADKRSWDMTLALFRDLF